MEYTFSSLDIASDEAPLLYNVLTAARDKSVESVWENAERSALGKGQLRTRADVARLIDARMAGLLDDMEAAYVASRVRELTGREQAIALDRLYDGLWRIMEAIAFRGLSGPRRPDGGYDGFFDVEWQAQAIRSFLASKRLAVEPTREVGPEGGAIRRMSTGDRDFGMQRLHILPPGEPDR